MTKSATIPAGAHVPPAVRIALRVWLATAQAGIALGRPLFLFAVRLLLARSLLASALVKVADWDVALTLATFEYPVPFIAPANAALLGVTIELVGGSLLLIGLCTRPAALAVAALAALSHLYYRPVDANLLALALTLALMVIGPGSISVDRLIGPGVRALPIAGVPQLAAVIDALSGFRAPIMAALRIWLGLTMFAVAGTVDALATSIWLPMLSFGWLPAPVALVLGALLLAGMALPLVAILLATSIGGMQLMGPGSGIAASANMVALLFLFSGAGLGSVDAWLGGWLHRHILFDRRIDRAPDDWPHIVVVGGGFGGLACVAALKRLPVRITVIDRNNFHLFQPLLYQIASAALSPADVATPIRSLYREDGNVRVLLGSVSGVDRAARAVQFGDERIGYDVLVLATGATHSYFGKDAWGAHAPGLKRIEDAVAVRANVLRAFERAESAGDMARVRRLLTFVIVGAGPTGVELAGAIAELARFGLRNEYRSFDPATARIILVQSGPRILPAFDARLSMHAMTALARLGVEVMTGARVTDIQSDHLMIGDERIDSETILWAAGVVASPAATWLGVSADGAGRAIVERDLTIAGDRDIFVIGDTAASMGWNGAVVPGLAPAAKQQGQYVGRVIRARLAGQASIAPFAYRHQGSLATIGRKSAVADFGRVKLHGALAWWLWGLVHVGFLVGVRNRASVLVNWVWSYFTMQLGIRLITSPAAAQAASTGPDGSATG